MGTEARESTAATKPRESIPGFVFGLAAMAAAVIGANLYLVYRSAHVQEDVVRDDYYEAGLHYDAFVSAQRRFDSLTAGAALDLGPDKAAVRFHFVSPETGAAWENQINRCEAVLYRPDDRRLDKVVPLEIVAVPKDTAAPVQASGLQWQGAPGTLKPGLWRVSVRWYADGVLVFERSFHHSV